MGSKPLIAHALRVLEQKKILLSAIASKDARDYTRRNLKFYGASVGSHTRHSLQHFNCLLNNPNVQASYNNAAPATNNLAHNVGRADVVVNMPVLSYDVRGRGTDIENDLDAATNEINKIVAILGVTPIRDLIDSDHGRSVTVKSIFVDYNNNDITTYSNIARELSFIAHHSLHHIAMMDLILKDFGYDFSDRGDSIGIAPSTAFYNQTKKE